MALALALASHGPGQSPLRGLVLDEHGAPIAGATATFLTDHDRFVTAELVAAPDARTDAAGRFTLPRPNSADWPVGISCSAPGRGTVVVTPGYLDLSPIVLPSARRLGGRVRDEDGRPVAGARILVRDWLSYCSFLSGSGQQRRFTMPEPCAAVLSDADGRFTVDSAADTALYVEVSKAGHLTQERGPFDSGQPLDFVLRPPTTVAFEVVDREGHGVAGASVELERTGPSFPSSSVRGTTDASGICRLPRLPGAFFVSVRDERRNIQADRQLEVLGELETLTLDAPQPTAAAAAPAPTDSEWITVHGQFLDPSRQRPIAGGTIWLAPGNEENQLQGLRWLDSIPGVSRIRVTTAADGSFTLTVPAGSYWLGACENATGERWHWIGTARNPDPRRFEVTAGKPPSKLVLELQPVVDRNGRVDCTGMPPMTQLRFVPDTLWAYASGDHLAFWPRTPIAADGTFTANELQLTRHLAQVILPRLPRQGLPDKVLVDRPEITAAIELALDLAAARPALVRGRVIGDLPLPRLAVVSMAVTEETKAVYGMVFYQGPIAPLQRDGRFVLREPPGRRRLFVVDLRTGVTLHRDELREVAPGSEYSCELEPLVHSCELRFASDEPLETMQLAIHVDAKQGPGGFGQMHDDCGPYRTHIAPDHEGFVLLLPPGPARLEIVQHPNNMRERSLTSTEVDATAGSSNRVTLRDR